MKEIDLTLTKAESIGQYAFQNCINLSKIIFNKELVTLQAGSFYHCGIISLILPENISILNS